MPSISLKRLWTDDDTMIQVKLSARSADFGAALDFYVYPKQLNEFGERLQTFQTRSDDVVEFEYGAPENFYSFLRLRVMVLDGSGRSAIEIAFDTRRKPPEKAEGRFYLVCYPATINQLGQGLVHWSQNPEVEFRYEWPDA